MIPKAPQSFSTSIELHFQDSRSLHLTSYRQLILRELPTRTPRFLLVSSFHPQDGANGLPLRALRVRYVLLRD